MHLYNQFTVVPVSLYSFTPMSFYLDSRRCPKTDQPYYQLIVCSQTVQHSNSRGQQLATHDILQLAWARTPARLAISFLLNFPQRDGWPFKGGVTYVLDIIPNLAITLKCHTTHEVDECHCIDRCTQ